MNVRNTEPSDRFQRHKESIQALHKKAKLAKACLVGERTEYYRNRVKSKVLDIVDARFPTGKKEPAEASSDHPEIILEKMLPKEYLTDFLAYLQSTFPNEGTYGCRAVVGKGPTRHPHDFIVENGEEKYRIMFLDPEEQVGTRDNTSPRIVNVLIMDIKEGEDSPEVKLAVGRYDTSRLSPEQRHPFLKMRTLRDLAPDFLETGALAGMPNKQTYFSLHITPDGARLVDSHASSKNLESVVNNPHTPLPFHSGVRQTFLVRAVLEYMKTLANQGHMQDYSDGVIHSVQK